MDWICQGKEELSPPKQQVAGYDHPHVQRLRSVLEMTSNLDAPGIQGPLELLITHVNKEYLGIS